MSFARTELGRKLREIRQRIKASGQPLLDWDEIDARDDSDPRGRMAKLRDEAIKWNRETRG